jgi:feruloyl esterase
MKGNDVKAHRSVRSIGMLAFAAAFAMFVGSNAEAASTDPTLACNALSGLIVPAHEIGLPTSGARVTSATFQTASGTPEKPEACKVLAQIAPVDARAQPIAVQVNLPSAWNGKAVQVGGGGFDGILVTGEGHGPGAGAQPTPLSLGYATFGSDSGHSVSNPFDVEAQVGAFQNDEVLANYSGAQLKKTHDLAMALIRLRYGKLPSRTYFVGASAGGREALAVAQKWGTDYDGAIAYYPAAGGLPLVIELGRLSRAFAAPGAYPNPAKQALLHKAVVAACDAADGARDGLVSNPSRCGFDVASLRCAGGGDEGDTCLSDAQIAALKTMASDLHLNYSLASGEAGTAGYHVFQGVDLTAPVSGLGAAAPSAMPLAPAQPIHDKFFDIFVRGWLMRDPHANSLAYDPERPGAYEARMSALSSIMEASDPDLSAFAKHGAKLIIVHGDDDSLIPVGWSTDYYNSVVRRMTAATVDGFLRFYTVPGYGHGYGAFIVDWDSLSALDRWVENGSAPVDPIVTDVRPGNRGRTRPLCRYPAWPRYNGAGDIDSAKSFTCASP